MGYPSGLVTASSFRHTVQLVISVQFRRLSDGILLSAQEERRENKSDTSKEQANAALHGNPQPEMSKD